MPAEFVNLDARWLVEFAEQFQNASGEPNRNYDADYARFIRIAEHLQSMDEKLQNLTANSNQIGEFERGVQAERLRIFGRSNLPPQSVEVSPELHAMLLKAAVPVKKIKQGVSAFDPLPAPKKMREVKKVTSPALKEILSGLKIDLSKLGTKQ